MDPVSLAGLALGVASIAVQIYQGCVQGIQLVVTAVNYPDDCRYLNLRLRMEQQRLFAWSETSGLLTLAESGDGTGIQASKAFTSPHHRSMVLDLLLQVRALFDEFAAHQRRHGGLRPAQDEDGRLADPGRDAAAARFPLSDRRRDLIRRALSGLLPGDKGAGAGGGGGREGGSGGILVRLRWVSFDKDAFEGLLARFAALNDAMTDLLDAQLQVEIRDSVQDTNRGVLRLHHRVVDIGRLVMALSLRLDAAMGSHHQHQHQHQHDQNPPPYSTIASSRRRGEEQSGTDAAALDQLADLARFKAFNAAMDGDEKSAACDEAAIRFLDLTQPTGRDGSDPLLLRRADIDLDDDCGAEAQGENEAEDEEQEAARCDAWLRAADGTRTRVWVEWKSYDADRPGARGGPSKQVIVDRVRRLAALLNHTPKPAAFRTPHCLGWFDKAAAAGKDDDNDDDDVLDHRVGLVFGLPPAASRPPVSLRELLLSHPRPSLGRRVALGHAVATCLLYLHTVSWLHKGLRSHNVIFFPSSPSSLSSSDEIDYASPCLSGFDFSRPARPDEETDLPLGDAEHDLYRHPQAQTCSARFSSGASSGSAPRERFKKSFDIYALGVLLFELAHWAPIERVLELYRDSDRHRYRRRGGGSASLSVRDRLLDPSRIADLAGAAGEVYADAARRCVAGGEALGMGSGGGGAGDSAGGGDAVVDGDDNEDDDGGRFYECVVKRLGEIRV